MTSIYNRPDQKEKRRALRQRLGQPERLLWQALRDRQLRGAKFRRQYGVGPYVLDFYAPSIKLAVEIDGDSHYVAGAERRDQRRAGYVSSFGIRFLRFTNAEVSGNLQGVLEAIAAAITTADTTSPGPSLVRRGIPTPPALPPSEAGGT